MSVVAAASRARQRLQRVRCGFARLASAPEEAFFFFGFVFEGAFRPLAVVGKDAGFDLAFLREGNALHVEGLIGRAFDGTALFIEDLHRQIVAAAVDVAQGEENP